MTKMQEILAELVAGTIDATEAGTRVAAVKRPPAKKPEPEGDPGELDMESFDVFSLAYHRGQVTDEQYAEIVAGFAAARDTSKDTPLPAVGANEARCGETYEVGIFVMDFDDSFGGLLAHAVVSVGERDDAYVNFCMFSGATMGYLWQSWVEIQSSWRRRSVTLIADVEDDGMKPYRAWDLGELSDEIIEALEDPPAVAPLELFRVLVQAVTPLVTVRPVDDEFMRTLPDRAPPWPYPGADAEIAGLPRWQGERIG